LDTLFVTFDLPVLPRTQANKTRSTHVYFVRQATQFFWDNFFLFCWRRHADVVIRHRIYYYTLGGIYSARDFSFERYKTTVCCQPLYVLKYCIARCVSSITGTFPPELYHSACARARTYPAGSYRLFLRLALIATCERLTIFLFINHGPGDAEVGKKMLVRACIYDVQ